MDTLPHNNTDTIRTPIFPQGAPKIAVETFELMRTGLRAALPKDGRFMINTYISSNGTAIEVSQRGAREADTCITFNTQTGLFSFSGEIRALPRIVLTSLKECVEMANEGLRQGARITQTQDTIQNAITAATNTAGSEPLIPKTHPFAMPETMATA